MLRNIIRAVREFRQHHRAPLALILIESLPRYSSAILYAFLTVRIAELSNEAVAGMAFSGFALFEFLVSDPLGGTLADHLGSRLTLRLNALFFCLAGLLLILIPNSLFATVIIGLLLFASFGLRVTNVYLLRMIKKNEGGLMFGLSENMIGLAYFFSTLSIPFLARTEKTTWVALLAVGSSLIYIVCLYFLPNDQKASASRPPKFGSIFNPWPTIKHGMHFIRVNHFYPLLPLGASLFEGIFYSTIWFLFPLKFSHLAASGKEGLELGIYDLVTALLAGVCGYLADRYNWKHIHSLGWILVCVGVILLPLLNVSLGLIIAGLIIAIGNNLSYFSAEHVLTKYDIDHREDGAFLAINTMAKSLGYVIAPIIVGFIYYRYGFSASLFFTSGVSILLGLWMIWQTWKME